MAATADERLTRVASALVEEARGAVGGLPDEGEIHALDDDDDAWRLVDALLTLRDPAPVPAALVSDLDGLLAERSRARAAAAGSPDALALPTLAETHGVTGAIGSHVALWKGDLTTLRAGAIVNAANSAMLGCRVAGHACIDNAIHAVAGPGLRAECASYMDARGGRPEETGRALLTGGYHLPAEHVIHTVGPIVSGPLTDEHRELLARSYRSVLAAADSAGLDSVGLCSVSTGVFGYPKDEAAQLVLATIEAWLSLHPESTMRIVISAYADIDVAVYEQALRRRRARRTCRTALG